MFKKSRPQDRPHFLKRMLHGLRIVMVAVLGAAVTLALWYRLEAPAPLVVILMAAMVWLTFWVIRATDAKMARKRRIIFAWAMVIMLLWWTKILPSHDRIWADDVAHIVTGTIEGDQLTLHNVRNFNWRTRTDYDVAWETRHYDLSDLQYIDMFLSTWANPAIAHTLVSFGFADGEHVTFSVEIRREKGEEFSEIAGFFKQYEIALIAADERDIIYTRSHVRRENVTRYRIHMPPAQQRALLAAYVERGNALAQTPEFYNTLTANCTTVVYDMVRMIVPELPLDIRVLLSGYLPSYIYKIGGLGYDETLAALTARANVPEDAPHDNFSEYIRQRTP